MYQELERVFHIKLFYNRKEGITPEQFNAYWANNHTKTAGDFHLRFGVYKYSQYHSTLSFETFFASLVQLPCSSSMALRSLGADYGDLPGYGIRPIL
ncbi:hypothetical protein FocnCong_v009785 [Fusarium oxysporum f. sp. conglutinans]|nr:hypothetical protein FocnCong_v009785 [Fusarium oxysporum f. sp. conglutinans]